MIKTDDATDDLIVLARRGDLPEPDERRLRELLATSSVSRELYEVGRALDAEAPMQSDDAERIDRLVRSVERRLRRPTLARTWLPRALLAAALLAGAAVGAARFAGTPPHRAAAPTPSAAPATTASPAPHAAKRRGGAGALAGAGNEPANEPANEPTNEPANPSATGAVAPEPVGAGTPHAVDPGSGPRVPGVAPRSRAPAGAHDVAPGASTTAGGGTPAGATTPAPPIAPTTSATSSRPTIEPVPSATELFSSANRARVRGDLAEAIRLSRDLEDRFPDSAEATTAQLSLGMLYLQTDQPALALDEFRRGHGERTAEALWGEAQALRQLGRAGEERTALEALLARYPRSAYTSAAQKRLDAPH